MEDDSGEKRLTVGESVQHTTSLEERDTGVSGSHTVWAVGCRLVQGS